MVMEAVGWRGRRNKDLEDLVIWKRHGDMEAPGLGILALEGVSKKKRRKI